MIKYKLKPGEYHNQANYDTNHYLEICIPQYEYDIFKKNQILIEETLKKWYENLLKNLKNL